MGKNNLAFDKNCKIDLQVDQMVEQKGGIWVCGKTARNKLNKQQIKRHAETHIEGLSHVCHICGKTFSTRQYLRQHISLIHSVLFTCDICGKDGMNRMTYGDHKRRNHKTISIQQ